MSESEWFPTLEEYNPEITEEQWIELVQDKTVFTKESLITFACLLAAKYPSCKSMVKEFGRPQNFYNNGIWQTGRRVHQKTNCPMLSNVDGGISYWNVCCMGQADGDEGFHFKIREELMSAFEKTGVLENVEIKSRFTWIPFYKEMAEKLLKYKYNRKELVDIVSGLGELSKYIFTVNKYDVDPFTIMGICNRRIKIENKIKILSYFKEKLNIIAQLPQDFDSVPELNYATSIYANDEECNSFWELFESALQWNRDNFIKQFNFAISVNKVFWNITMGLYWINPTEFMPLDGNSRTYLTKINIPVFKDKDFNGENYLTLLNTIKDKINNNEIKERSFMEISYNAWKNDSNSEEKDNMDNNTYSKYINLLKKNKNIILHGAPGTGKTFLARGIANAMGCPDDNIGFVQFHPSYDYTDFVEGLRPDKNGGFERVDGVFKKFCRKAFISKSVDNEQSKLINDVPTVWKVSLEGAGDNNTRKDCMENGWIRIGWPGYGDVDFDEFDDFYDGGKAILRTFQKKMEIGDIVLSCSSAWDIDAIGVIIGDYEYREDEGAGYPRYRNVKWLVKGIQENIIDINHGARLTPSTVYKLQISLPDILNIVKKYSTIEDVTNSQQPFVFIIDEINRGELSKIFGELFFTIDPGYRGEKGLIQTQYQNLIEAGDTYGKGFYIPENVYIIGTMNDIDRSVESMDFAMRRRFAFVEVTAEESAKNMNLSDTSINKMTAINNELKDIDGLNKSYFIGGAYFLKADDKNKEDEKLSYEELWNYHLEGLIREYLRGIMPSDEIESKLISIKSSYDKAE